MTLVRALALALLLIFSSGAPLLANQPDSRSLGMAITVPEHGDFENALAVAIEAGVTRVPLTFSWRSLEPEPQAYDDRSLAIAALILPAMGLSIDLAITPTSGDQLSLPPDLKGRSFDDPDVVTRYLALLDHVLTVLEGADVRLLLVGVEVDRYLGDDSDAWARYATFAGNAATFIHDRRPGTEVGVQSSTYSRLQAPDNWQAVDAISDVIATSYYPLDGTNVRDPSNIAADFDALTAQYPDRVIRIVETGFPSSKVNGSSPDLQAQFIHELFAAWDQHADQIHSITLWTEYDYSPQELGHLNRPPGQRRDPYVALIGSIGLRQWDGDGAPKPAWGTLLQETASRGWSS